MSARGRTPPSGPNAPSSSTSFPGKRRTGDGETQEGLARPGTGWLVPAGTNETLLELDDAAECLMVYLPDKLLDSSATADYDIDPSRTRLAYAGGFADPTLAQITTALHGLLHREPSFLDRIFADGLRTALAAHLIGKYSVDSWRPANTKAPTLEPRRLGACSISSRRISPTRSRSTIWRARPVSARSISRACFSRRRAARRIAI